MARFDIDEALIRKLARVIEETGLTEIEYSEGRRTVRVSRRAGGVEAAPAMVAAPAAPAPAAEVKAEAPASGGGVPDNAVCSPMVGTAYLAPGPGERPFVSAGDGVRKGQTVMIVEAMKVMNPITAPRDGTVKEIFVDDGQPVEYGEPLLVIA